MTCEEIHDRLLDDLARRAEFKSHLLVCPHCAGFLRQQEQLDLELLTVFERHRLPTDFTRQILAAVDQLPPLDPAQIALKKAQFESEFRDRVQGLTLGRALKRQLWPGLVAVTVSAWALTRLTNVILPRISEGEGIASYLVPPVLWLSVAVVLGVGGVLLAARAVSSGPQPERS